MMTANCFRTAAAGNARAIEALSIIARSTNAVISKEARRALENAAFKQQPAAAEAPRGLGYQ